MDANKLKDQRSLSADAVTDRLNSIKTERLSITPNPCMESQPQAQASSLRGTEDKINPTAKVSAWLESLSSPPQIDDGVDEGPRDATAITASKPCSLQLQPISGDVSSLDGHGDSETLDQLRGKAIPPITSSKTVDATSDSENADDKDIERDTSVYDYDICSSRATIDSLTSSTLLSSLINTGSPNTQRNDTETIEQTPPGQPKNDSIIKVKEADDNDIAKENIRKIFGSAQSNEPGTSGTADNKERSSGKLSFGGVANALLQWKLNQARALKRRSKSIAIDAKHFALMGAIADKVKTQLPRSLIQSLKEEAHPILVQTVQAYKSEIGKSHRLTHQARKRLEELTEELRLLQ